MQVKEFYYPSCDGIHDIHAIEWRPEGAVRAVVQISHGMIEYIRRYEELAEYLTAHGILAAGNDHLGHGQSVISEREWGFFASGDASGKVVQDLHTLTLRLRRENPDVPFFLLGHSMGSFMARRYAMTYGRELDGLILAGTGNQPMAAVAFGRLLVGGLSLIRGERHRSRLVNQIVFGMYNQRIRPVRTKYDWISRDEKNVDSYCQDPACTFLFTLNGYKTLFGVLTFIQKRSNMLRLPQKLPMLLLSGEEDPVGNYGKSVRQVALDYRKCGVKDISIKLYPEDRHEIFNETDREDVYEELCQWLIKQIGHTKKDLTSSRKSPASNAKSIKLRSSMRL